MGIPLNLGWKSITYSDHAKKRFEERKGGQFYVLPSLLNLESRMVRKVYIDGERIVKYKIRIHYNEKKWLCMILTSNFICKTLWWEEKNYEKKNIGDINYAY